MWKKEQGVSWEPFFYWISSKNNCNHDLFCHHNINSKILIKPPTFNFDHQVYQLKFRSTAVNSSDLSWNHLQLQYFWGSCTSIRSVCANEKGCRCVCRMIWTRTLGPNVTFQLLEGCIKDIFHISSMLSYSTAHFINIPAPQKIHLILIQIKAQFTWHRSWKQAAISFVCWLWSSMPGWNCVRYYSAHFEDCV